MIPALSALATVLLSLPSVWQEPAQEGPAPEDLQPKRVELEGESAIIPFTLDGGRPIPLVEAMVNGKGPFLFFYDTGASVCVLDSGFVKELGIESRGTTEVGDHTANARIAADNVEMATLELNGIRFESVPALAFDRSSLRGDEIRGVLGLPLFHDHLLTLDYEKRQMKISAQTLPEEGLGILPYGGEGLLPEMMITVGEREISCHIDSGSPTGLMLPTSFVEGLDQIGEPTMIGQARTVNSVLDIWSVQLAETATIAGNDFVAPTVVYNEMIPNALIGYRVLKDMVLSIDQRSKRLRLLPHATHVELAGIERAILDYAESYYEVKPSYVERSIHQELAKIGYTWHEGKWKTHPMDYDGFVAMVQWLIDSDTVPEPGPKEVVVLAATDQTALIRLTGSWGIDYMQVARFDGRWQTRHVVWQSVPEPRSDAEIEQDRGAVRQVVQEYLAAMHGDRIELFAHSLHPEMVAYGSTRGNEAPGTRNSSLSADDLHARVLREDAEEGGGADTSGGSIRVLGVMDRVACVELRAEWGVDYLHLIKSEDGNWTILHILSHAAQ